MNEPGKQDERSLSPSGEQMIFAWVGTPEMLARRVWELEQRIVTLGDAHATLVTYVENLEARIESLEDRREGTQEDV